MSKRISDNRAGSEHVVEQLSAYIDNALDAGERERVRAHVETCEGCRTEYQELRATKQMLFSMPVAKPPRAFTLTQEMVASKPSVWQRLRMPIWYPRLATGSVVAFALLVMVLLGNLANTQNSAAPMMSAPAHGERAMDIDTPSAAMSVPANTSSTPEAVMEAANPAEPTAMAVAGAPAQEVRPTSAAKAASDAPATSEPGRDSAQAPASTAVRAPDLNMGMVAGTPQAGDMWARSGFEESQARPRAAEQPLPYSPAPANDVSWAFILQVSLAVLGVALGVGAIIARMRGV